MVENLHDPDSSATKRSTVDKEAGRGSSPLTLQNVMYLFHCEFLVLKVFVAHADPINSDTRRSSSWRFTAT